MGLKRQFYIFLENAMTTPPKCQKANEIQIQHNNIHGITASVLILGFFITHLIYWDLDKMFKFRLEFHWSFFPRVQLHRPQLVVHAIYH